MSTKKIYRPADIVLFGQYKGSSLGKVFKYHPHYVDWAVINIEEFAIDMEEFDKLPKPTPVQLQGAYKQELEFTRLVVEKYNVEFNGIEGRKFPYFSGNELLVLIDEFISEKGYRPKMLDFKFSYKAQEVNKEKVEYFKNYSEPYYEPPDPDWEREYFEATTDGQLEDYADFKERGGDLDYVDDWAGR